MKICIVGLEVLSVLMPGYEQYRVGGEQVQLTLLGRALKKRGYEVSMVVLDYGQADELVYEGINIIKAYSVEGGVTGVRFIYPRLIKLWNAIKKADADVYYTSCAGFQVGVVAYFCKLYKRKCLYKIAHDNDCYPDKLLIKLWRDKKFYEYGIRNQHEILAQSEQQQKALFENYGLASKTSIMLVDKPEETLGLEERDIDILWVNNMRQFKRPDLVIELAKVMTECNVHIIGGANEPDLYNKIEKIRGIIYNFMR